MDQLSLLLEGFAGALTPINLLWVLIGAVLGTAVGVLPGLGSSMAVALLLPITFSLDPTAAFIMFAGIYFGGMFGDSTAAILLNTPGNSTAIASTFEGHRMARNGRGGKALATAAIGAFIGGIIATMLTVIAMPLLTTLATMFGPAEYFALAVFAFLAVSSVVAESITRGLAALGIGLALTLIGIDGPSGTERFTFGVPQLFDGLSIVVITVGLLALGEVLSVAGSVGRRAGREEVLERHSLRLTGAELKQALPAWLRGTAFGLPFGIIPAGGAEVPTFLAYGTEKRLAKSRGDRSFGTTGSIKGLAAPEAAANATSGTAMGALLALGLPTSATAAIMIAAFQQYGLQPGPLLFTKNSELVWTLLASLFVGLVVLLVLNLGLAGLWVKLLEIPKPYLYAGITILSVLGVYAASSSVVDLVVLLGIGLVGLLMRRARVPLAPVMIAVVLGPLAETELRRALAVAEGDASALVASPFTFGIYAVLVLGIIVSIIQHLRNRAKPETDGGNADAVDADGPAGSAPLEDADREDAIAAEPALASAASPASSASSADPIALDAERDVPPDRDR